MVRGLLREFGVNIAVGASHVQPRVVQVLAEGRLAHPLLALLPSVLAEIGTLDQSIAEAERELKTLAKEMDSVKRLETIPGIGLLTSTALVASIGEPSR